MGLLRTLFIILVIYYALKLIGRFVLPLLFKKAVDTAQKNMERQMQEMYNQQQKQKQEGEVTIKFNAKQQQGKDTGEGEYVDYEEVK
jgi:sortase (surface protein transpeptidase)